eukprot:284819009_1
MNISTTGPETGHAATGFNRSRKALCTVNTNSVWICGLPRPSAYRRSLTFSHANLQKTRVQWHILFVLSLTRRSITFTQQLFTRKAVKSECTSSCSGEKDSARGWISTSSATMAALLAMTSGERWQMRTTGTLNSSCGTTKQARQLSTLRSTTSRRKNTYSCPKHLQHRTSQKSVRSIFLLQALAVNLRRRLWRHGFWNPKMRRNSSRMCLRSLFFLYCAVSRLLFSTMCVQTWTSDFWPMTLTPSTDGTLPRDSPKYWQ